MSKEEFFYGAVLDKRIPQMQTFCGKEVREIVKERKLKSYKDIGDADHYIFNSEDKCDKFLTDFANKMQELKLHPIGAMESGSSLLCKRRYLALSLMGQKKSTVRTYDKKWIKGTIINLYDQTYFLKCKLLSIKDIGAGEFEYNYKLI